MTIPLYLAPVRGISDMIYRNAFNRHFGGIDVAMTPFLTVTKGTQLKELQLAELREENNTLPIIPQIIGKSAENFIELSKTLHDIGVAEINWNLGCPYTMKTKKKLGSGLLPHPDLIQLFLDKVCAETKTKLSIKVRLGLNTPDELEKLIPIFNQYPIVEMTIHPRTAKQMYSGDIDFDSFQRALDLSTIPVIYNGDIFSKEEYESIISKFPNISGLMLGRGLFRNPFLASEIKGEVEFSQEQRVEKLKNFHNELLENYKQRLSGDTHLIMKMIGHSEYLTASTPQGPKFYKKIKLRITIVIENVR